MNSYYEQILKEIYHDVQRLKDNGIVAQYIPELASIDPSKFGVHLCTSENENYGVGDHEEKFSIQSIGKVLSLALAFQQKGEDLWDRVGVEPSGNPFNSLWQLEYEHGKPRNPLINSGAIVICDILCSLHKHPHSEFLDFVRKVAGNHSIEYNQTVANSEKKLGFRNAALINMMKASGNIHNEIDEVLNLYYQMCSIEMSCKELASTFLLFANHGKLISSGEQIITSSMAKRINAIMQTCGFYDEAGDFSFKVGLPGKSGIGGGIVAVHPGKYAVAVWSPRLNKKGNSVRGMELLERLTTKTGLSIF
ncbi:MAG: glutaminase [Saprospiraceae bacterium]|uniref:Glutaminase n=1 Tax=Candidatus Opimibacter skivensis TaxID=2982028 RepID=A0A9D7XN20_9BACT|nr:glutaminase [Candidatus Opimibacter skivensis]